MRLVLSTYLAYCLVNFLWLSILFKRFEGETGFVIRQTKRNKQMVDYKSIELRVLYLDVNKRAASFEILPNIAYKLSDNNGNALVIKAELSEDQIKTIQAKKADQIEANLRVIIKTQNNIPRMEIQVIRITEYELKT